MVPHQVRVAWLFDFIDISAGPTLSLRLWQSCSCPPDSPAPSALARLLSGLLLAFFIFWEILHVYLFPQSGGNCAQVVRRRRLRADAGTLVFTSRPHFDGQGKSEIYAFSRHRRPRRRDQRREGDDHRRQGGAEGLPALHRLSGRSAHGRVQETYGTQARIDRGAGCAAHAAEVKTGPTNDQQAESLSRGEAPPRSAEARSIGGARISSRILRKVRS